MSKDHYELGRNDALEGRKRYKFQDPYLQTWYDKGYDGDDFVFTTKLGDSYKYCRGCGVKILKNVGFDYCNSCA